MAAYNQLEPGVQLIKKNEILREIFQFPEFSIPNLFMKIEEKWQPRRFRKSVENPLGFDICIENEEDFNCLQCYNFEYDDGFKNDNNKVSMPVIPSKLI